MIQIKIMVILLYSYSYFDMFRGPFLSGHGVVAWLSASISQFVSVSLVFSVFLMFQLWSQTWHILKSFSTWSVEFVHVLRRHVTQSTALCRRWSNL